jgi:hypothetical protein
MKMSGLIRRTRVNPRRFTTSRMLPPLIASPDGTGHRGPEGHHSGPGYLFSGRLGEVVLCVPKVISGQSCRLRNTRSNYE